MCGIYGVWNRNGRPLDLDLVERATSLIRHRGPDDEGYLLADTALDLASHFRGADTDPAIRAPHIRSAHADRFDLALGFRRLSIVDLSPLGHQPMQSADGRYWMVFNGEVYNYRDIRHELRSLGHAFTGNSDSEVILAAYAQWGPACLERFNGMWGLAIWDARDRELFVARDRFGVKPVYYVQDGAAFAFASEIKALVGPHGVAFEPSGHAIVEYVGFGRQPDPRSGDTFYANVRALPPGHWLRVSHASVAVVRYYNLRERTTSPPLESDDARVAGFRELLTDAVRLRLNADVPVGTCLSGGLDSSSIVLLANRFLGQPDATQLDVRQRTFSAVYDEPGRYNEREHVEAVVAMTHAQPHFVVPTAARLADEADRMVWHQEEPFGSTSIFAQWCVMALARAAGVTVLLDGQGADEALGGYLPFDVRVAELLRRGRAVAALHEAIAGGRVMGVSAARTVLRAAFWTLPLSVRRIASRTRAHGALEVLQRDVARSDAARGPALGKRPDLSEHLYDQVERNLPELLRYEDRNSMAFHIEARVPFVDYRLMEYCFVHARDHRIRDGWTKYLLRRAMTDVLPESIAWRRDKVGFETPESSWMRSFLKARPETWNGKLASEEYVRPEAMRGHAKAALAGGLVPPLLWRLVNLELWMQSWGASAPARVLPREAVGA